MYTTTNFKSKKALKEAVALSLKGEGPPVRYYQPGPFGGSEPSSGRFAVEGPHYPKPHTWFAECVAEDGRIIKVK